MTLDKRDFPGATFPEWMYKYTSRRTWPTGAKGGYRNASVVVHAGLHYLRGNRLPYFSVTCDIYEGKTHAGGGASHDLILKLWPKLAPVVALHLSDSDGAPMHDGANGWYDLAGYYGGAGERYHRGNSPMNFPVTPPEGKTWPNYESRNPTPDECLAMFAEHVRIPLDDARTLAEDWRKLVLIPWQSSAAAYWIPVKAALYTWIDAQRPRWKAEADSACALLNSLIAAQGKGE